MTPDNPDQAIEDRPTAAELRARDWLDVTCVGEYYRKFLSPAGVRVLVTKTPVVDELDNPERL